MKKFAILYISLLVMVSIALAACATQNTINGLWQNSEEIGTLEFKDTGEVIIVDNMSATVTGYYEIGEDDSITFELLASDILRPSVQPIPKTVITAKIIKLTGDALQLGFPGEEGVENYRRVR